MSRSRGAQTVESFVVVVDGRVVVGDVGMRVVSLATVSSVAVLSPPVAVVSPPAAVVSPPAAVVSPPAAVVCVRPEVWDVAVLVDPVPEVAETWVSKGQSLRKR